MQMVFLASSITGICNELDTAPPQQATGTKEQKGVSTGILLYFCSDAVSGKKAGKASGSPLGVPSDTTKRTFPPHLEAGESKFVTTEEVSLGAVSLGPDSHNDYVADPSLGEDGEVTTEDEFDVEQACEKLFFSSESGDGRQHANGLSCIFHYWNMQ